jgi:hypothetical protein
VAEEVVAALHSRRRRRAALAQKLQHVIPALGLAFGATAALRAAPGGLELAIAVAEVATTALLVVAFARDLRPGGGHRHTRIDWIDVWAAAVLFTEAAERWRAHHHVARPTILTGVVTLGLGLMHSRVEARQKRRHSVRVAEDHLFIGGRPFRRLTVPWLDIASITVGDRSAEVRMHDGRRRRIDLAGLENPSEVAAALEAARKRLAGTSA